MSDFDYGNARLHAMKSRLLSRRTQEGLSEAGSVQGLITALTNTAYREAVEAALVRLAGVECLAEALRNDLVATVGKSRDFFTGPAGELAAIVLGRYDLHNVKTVLRGLARQAPADEILSTTLPIGELRPADLRELSLAANFRAAIDLLATWRVPLARPILELRAGRRNGGADVWEMELALDRWRLREALKAAREAEEAGKSLLEALLLEADAANILTVLRLVGVPDAAAVLRERFHADDVSSLFIGPGSIPFAPLAEAARRPAVADAVNALRQARTPYGAMLAGALDAYAAAGRLSVIERSLARRGLRHAAALFARDSLGIGVLLGYVALKTNEVANLRTIAQGLLLGERPDRIQAELMFAGGET